MISLNELIENYKHTLTYNPPEYYFKQFVKKKLICKLHNDRYLSSIAHALPINVRKHAWIHGGACLSHLHDENPSDYDILVWNLDDAFDALDSNFKSDLKLLNVSTERYKHARTHMRVMINTDGGKLSVDLIKPKFYLFEPKVHVDFTFNSIYMNLYTGRLNLNEWSTSAKVMNPADISSERLIKMAYKAERYGYKMNFEGLPYDLVLSALGQKNA